MTSAAAQLPTLAPLMDGVSILRVGAMRTPRLVQMLSMKED
jgi:hypothetical protein